MTRGTAIIGDDRPSGALVLKLLDLIELRANSTLISIFGDAISPRGGEIWLGSLIALAAPLGISERLVRTGVYRLSNEGWLQSKTRGRRAYYSLTKAGAEKFHEAQRRIYASETVNWDGKWRLVQLLNAIPQPTRTALRRELEWHGFGRISPTLFAHPTESMDAILRLLQRHGLAESALVFRAGLANFVTDKIVVDVVRAAWDLDALNKGYERFIELFSPFDEAPKYSSDLNRGQAFTLRILLIHDFRRILLKDPVLPDSLLPSDWLGGKARDLCASIYLRIAPIADSYLVSRLETESGVIPALPNSYHARFLGLGNSQQEDFG